MAVWVRIPGLPIEYFREDAIKEILATVGTPLKLDMTTAGVQRGKFARGAVEIDLTKPLVAVVMMDDQPRHVKFEGLHAICFDCGEVGHRSGTCPKKHNAVNTAQETPQAKGSTEQMQVEEPQAPMPIAKHGAWMIVNCKLKVSERGPAKSTGKPKGETKHMLTNPSNGTRAARNNTRTGDMVGGGRSAGNAAGQG